jgi:WD40 repeat protein
VKLSSLLGVLLVAGVVSAAGCKKEQESLIVVALTADSGAANLRTLTLSAQSPSVPGASKTFSINGLSATAISYGLYVPGDVVGDVTVSAVATDPASCVGYSGKTTPAIRIASAGSIAQATIMLRAINTCQGDGGAGTSGQAGRGGGSGTTGSAGNSGAAGAPPSLATCNEYYLHAASTCTLGDADDVEIVSLAFSPDGKYLVTGASGAAKVWTFSGNTPVAEGHTLTGTGFAVVGFSSTGLLAVGWKGSVEVWNTTSWTKQQTLALASSSNQSYDVGFSPDGQQVISIDVNTTSMLGNLNVHSIGAAAALQKVALSIPWALSVSPVAVAGGSLAAVSDQSGQVSVYTVSANLISSPTVLTATTGSTAYAVRFSPDGTLLAAGGASDGVVHFWNVPLTSASVVAPDIDVIAGTSGWSDDVDALAFSPNSHFITVGAGFFGSITTWNVPTPRGMLDFNANPLWDISAIAVSPGGGMIAAGEYDCGIVMICGS